MSEEKCEHGGPTPRCGEDCSLDECVLLPTPEESLKFIPIAVIVNNDDGTATNHINGDTIDAEGNTVETGTDDHTP